ncbi:MAG: hypothetical protein ACJAZ2_001694 [Glaciecola sp.]|jgi:hypothetical protein
MYITLYAPIIMYLADIPFSFKYGSSWKDKGFVCSKSTSLNILLISLVAGRLDLASLVMCDSICSKDSIANPVYWILYIAISYRNVISRLHDLKNFRFQYPLQTLNVSNAFRYLRLLELAQTS